MYLLESNQKSPERNFYSVKKHSSKILANFTMLEQSTSLQNPKTPIRHMSSAKLAQKSVE